MATYELFKNILLFIDAESLIRYGGLLVVCLIVYGTTGLFFFFFVPSGVVLFTAGIFTATGDLANSLFVVCLLLVASSVVGTMTGYWFGRKAGRVLYRRKDTWYFRRQYLVTAENFYKKFGGFTMIGGYFLPVIRTFAPVVAGMIRVKWNRFVFLSIAGSVIWIVSFVGAGYYIGTRPFLKPWIQQIVIGFVLIITIPLLIWLIRQLKMQRKGRETKR